MNVAFPEMKRGKKKGQKGKGNKHFQDSCNRAR